MTARNSDMKEENHFTVFVRLPFARGEFVDPPPYNWTAAKERELWKVLSRSSKGNEIDWRALADRHDVSQAFLLQQAAWLYERQMQQVRAQVKKLSLKPSTLVSYPVTVPDIQARKDAASPAAGHINNFSSKTSTRRTNRDISDGQSAHLERSGFTLKSTEQPTPKPLRISESPEQGQIEHVAGVIGSSRAHSRQSSAQHQITRSPKPLTERNFSSSDEEMTQSRLIPRRPNPATVKRASNSKKVQPSPQTPIQEIDDLEEEDDDEPAFLPFSGVEDNSKIGMETPRDSAATLRSGTTFQPASTRRNTSERESSSSKLKEADHAVVERMISSSSASDGPVAVAQASVLRQARNQPQVALPSPLSGQQQEALAKAAGLSPRVRKAREDGSDTSPSIGSSFSDLDDKSVTQSALEEALLSGMGDTTMTMGNTIAGVANRVSSGVSQALRTRYSDARTHQSQS